MTTPPDPIRTAAEQLAEALPLAPPTLTFQVVDLIAAAFRQQRAEAEQQARVDGWCDVCAGTGKVVSADRCICDGTGLAAQAMVNFRVALVKAEQQRDKWLKAFNDSEQFQNGPTKRAEAAEARLAVLEAALREIETRDTECQCDHSDEDCCAKQGPHGLFCAHCFAHAVLEGSR